MNQEKIGVFIRKIRKNNNLTQKDLAEKYGVTYQAVSKWENGKNLPDLSLLKQMCKDFNVSLDDLLDGEVKSRNKKNKVIVIFGLLIVIIGFIVGFIYIKKDNSFEFKTLSSTCSEFDISGSIAYDNNKSSIYISNIDYCGEDKEVEYRNIDCVLYEVNGGNDIKIDTYEYSGDGIELDDFLKEVRFHIDKYDNICKEYVEGSLYILINAYNDDGKIISYNVPISLNDDCN